MPNYIRAYVPGASYFFTLTLLERRRHLLTENIDDLRDAFRTVRQKPPFSIDAIVILPDHLHCIWTLPDDDTDYSTPMIVNVVVRYFFKYSDLYL